jgi:hypothetical protein
MLPHLENPESLRNEILRQARGQVVTTAWMVMPKGNSVDRAERLATNPYLHNLVHLQLPCLCTLTVSNPKSL